MKTNSNRGTFARGIEKWRRSCCRSETRTVVRWTDRSCFALWVGGCFRRADTINGHAGGLAAETCALRSRGTKRGRLSYQNAFQPSAKLPAARLTPGAFFLSGLELRHCRLY
jgi:hypothetical protein